jgi:biotin carboxylase
MARVLLLATTTGYQTRAFGEAAERLGVELVFATDRCNVLDDPWQDAALPIRFYDEEGSLQTLLDAAAAAPIDGVLAVGDRPTLIAARLCEALGLNGHRYDAVRIARNKRLTRERLREAGLLVPWFQSMAVSDDPRSPGPAGFPCVVKPAGLSGSRGVMRVDDEAGLLAAFDRLRALLQAPDIRNERSEIHDLALIEGFIAGRELALEGLRTGGVLQTLAIFDKPDPLDGPFFEETIYATPSEQPDGVQRMIAEEVARAAAAIGLHHGPIHAECRINGSGVFVLEVAARPIGGLCARALRFQGNPVPTSNIAPISLEELLLRHALGEPVGGWERERAASAVMMIPIPGRGVFRGVSGVDDARSVPGIDEVRITAKADQMLIPLPEGASYPGFIFARAESAPAAVAALREAHARLAFAVDPEVRVLQSAHG